MKRKTFKIITFGCRTNQAESRMIGEGLVRNKFIGFNKLLVNKKLKDRIKPNIVIINSCVVTKKAEKEVRQMIRKVKRENPGCFLVVTGCFINNIKNQKAKIKNTNKKLLKLIDLLVENKDKLKIPEILKKQLNNETIEQSSNGTIYRDKYFKSKKALIKVQDGCDNFCTYCIVPYLRGRSSSRPAEEIIEEIREKVEQRVKEIVLTGIDIAAYGREIKNKKLNINLTNLLRKILIETEVERISFGSMNLEAFNGEFINLASSFQLPATSKPRIVRHFHIPLQSGSNETLRRMNRRYTIEEYKKVIAKLREKIPGVTFSTDVMVGFPGETEEEFEESLKNIREIEFVKLHVFRYSPREGTLAARMERKWGKIPERVKKERARKTRGLIRKG